MAVEKWLGVSVSMQSALAAADTITGITKANPGVATSVAHGMSNGTYVYLETQGMYQLNGKVARIANVSADTFELEGIDTSSFDTFSSGTAKAITFGTTISTMADLSASGGEAADIDITTIHDEEQVTIPGLKSASKIAFNNLFDLSEAGLVAMQAADATDATRAFKVVWKSGTIAVFAGRVSVGSFPTGNAGEVVKLPAVITALKKPTYYSA